ncbi:MAG: hypothetical protein ACYC19_10115, partial [Acidimicrobiales bacterium]
QARHRSDDNPHVEHHRDHDPHDPHAEHFEPGGRVQRHPHDRLHPTGHGASDDHHCVHDNTVGYHDLLLGAR